MERNPSSVLLGTMITKQMERMYTESSNSTRTTPARRVFFGIGLFLGLAFLAMSWRTIRVPERLSHDDFLAGLSDAGEDTSDSERQGEEGTPIQMSEAQAKQENVHKMTGLEKIAKFPECASTRRVEHPGAWDGPRVQYVHNPKAGGTSIQIACAEWSRKVPGTRLLKYDSPSVGGSSSKCPGLALDSTVLAGHRGYGFCTSVDRSSRGLFTFTAFRDAVSRVVSWYDYNLFRINERRAQIVFGKEGPSLSEWVKKFNATPKVEYGEKLLRYAGQQQARFMCGYQCMGPIASGNKNLTEDEVLRRALLHLNKMDVVGLTEEMNRMILQLKFHLPNLIPKEFHAFKRDNVNGKKSQLDDQSRAILRQWSWVDTALYEEAKKIYFKKQRIAEKCLKLFGELDEKDVLLTEEEWKKH